MERRCTPAWQRFLLAPRGPALRYGVAVLLATGSLALVRAMHELEGTELTSLALVSVVLSAMYGGLGPALLDTAITAVGVDYLFSPPVYRVFDSWSSVLRILTFALVGYLIADLVAALGEAYRRLREEHRETELAKRAREDILAIVSHDLRSPLSSILLGAEYVKRVAGGASPEELRDATEAIARSGRQMSRLIDDLLDAVKVEKGQFRIEPAEHDLAAIVEDAVQGVRAAAQAKGVEVRCFMPHVDYHPPPSARSP